MERREEGKEVLVYTFAAVVAVVGGLEQAIVVINPDVDVVEIRYLIRGNA